MLSGLSDLSSLAMFFPRHRMSLARSIYIGCTIDGGTVKEEPMDEHMRRIVADLKDGSHRAWAQLYEAYSERLAREVARLMGGSPADIADVLQETWAAAAKSVRRVDLRRGSVWSWLLLIARDQVALHWRKHSSSLARARKWWASLNGASEEWISGSIATPPEVLASKETAVLVRTALQELPAEYQALLTRRYLDGESAEQIACQTDSTGEAVRAKLMRARKAFQQIYMNVARGALPEKDG